MNRTSYTGYACVLILTALLSSVWAGCRPATTEKEHAMSADHAGTVAARDQVLRGEVATFGAGCFWCVEAVFQNLKGVSSVVSGYAGGTTANPTYEQVSTGTTGHAEVCQITFDPQQISYGELLEVFWAIHDPTTLNRQGPDVGSQYRSVVLYHTQEQRARAEASKREVAASGVWKDPIVTEISPYAGFYKAEDYHQNYYRQNKNQPYCRLTIRPKVEKTQKLFKDRLQPDKR
jgi:peptide-methionine (S)-S-oxide reductase